MKLWPRLQPSVVSALTWCGIIVLLPFINHWHWLLDLLSHFQLQVVIAQIPILLLCWYFKYRKETVASCVILSIALFHLSPLLGWPSHSKTESEHTVKITALNVLHSNSRYSEVIEYLKSEKSDLLVLSEMTPAFTVLLKENFPDYPYQVHRPREDAFGMSLLSRHPISEQDILSGGKYGEPILKAEIDFAGKPITIFGVHPVPPLGKNASASNAQYLEKLTELCRNTETPVILAGDFNATPWGDQYQRLIKNLDYTNCALGENTLTTWNRFMDFSIPCFGLMLDHILYSKDFEKKDFKVTSDLGSDHDGVSAELVLKP